MGDGQDGAVTFQIKGTDFQYFSRLRKPNYRFKEVVTDNDLRQLVKQVLDQKEADGEPDGRVPQSIRDAKGTTVQASKFLGTILVRRRAAGKGPVGAGAPIEPSSPPHSAAPGLVPISQAPDGKVWLSAEHLGAEPLERSLR